MIIFITHLIFITSFGDWIDINLIVPLQKYKLIMHDFQA